MFSKYPDTGRINSQGLPFGRSTFAYVFLFLFVFVALQFGKISLGSPEILTNSISQPPQRIFLQLASVFLLAIKNSSRVLPINQSVCHLKRQTPPPSFWLLFAATKFALLASSFVLLFCQQRENFHLMKSYASSNARTWHHLEGQKTFSEFPRGSDSRPGSIGSSGT